MTVRGRRARVATAVGLLSCLLGSACGLDWTVPPEVQDRSTASPGTGGSDGGNGPGGSSSSDGAGGDAATSGVGGAPGSGSGSPAATGSGGGAQGSGGGMACVSSDAAECAASATAEDCRSCAMDVPTLCGNAADACDASCQGAANCFYDCEGNWECENACYVAWSSCDDTCSQLWTCVDLCSDDACVSACYGVHPGAADQFRDLQTCLHCNGCGSITATGEPDAYQEWCCSP